MTLKTSIIIGGDSSGGVAALDDLTNAMGKTGDAANDAGATVSAAMMKALEAIVENTDATSRHVAALVAGTAASRQRADAASAQAQADRAAAAAANDNARAEQTLAAQAAALRAAIDPMYSAQQRFNQQLEIAEALLAQNTITEREYASAIQLAREQLQAAAAAANGQAQAERAAAAAASEHARAEQVLAQQAAALRAAIDPMYAAQQRFNQQLTTADALLAANAITEREYAAAITLARQELQAQAKAVAGSTSAVEGSANAQANSVTSAHGRMSVSSQILMHSIRSANDSFAAGLPVTMIVTEQMGRLGEAAAYAAQESGKTSGVMAVMGRVMGGPWAIAIMAGITLASSLASHLLEDGDAAENAKNKSYDFSVGLDVMALKIDVAADAMKQLSDATRSAIKVQGDFLAVMGQTADASVEAYEKRIADTSARIEALRGSWASLSNLNPATAIWKAYQISQLEAQNETDKAALKNAKAAQTNFELATSQRKVTDQLDASAAATDRYNTAVGKLTARYKASKDDPIGTQLAGTFLGQDGYEAELKTAQQARDKAIEQARKKTRTPRTRTPVDRTAATENFSQDTGNRIANIADQYGNLPTAVEKANKSMRELDGIIGDIERKAKEKGVKLFDAPALIASAQAAKAAIQANLSKPFDDYMQKQRESVEIDRLMAAGQDDQAAALKVVLDLKTRMGPLDEAQSQAILEAVSAEQRRALALRDTRALITANVQAVQDMRTALNQTVADALKGNFSYNRILSSIGTSYVNIMSQRIVENLFGDALRGLEDQARQNFATAMDKGSTAVTSFADTVNRVIAKIEGKPVHTTASTAETAGGASAPDASDGGITVVGKKPKSIDVSGTAALMLQLTNVALHGFGAGLPKTLLEGLKPVLSKLEKSLPDALQGAFTGSAASKLILGSGTSSIGGGLGGAIGQEMGKKFLTTGLDTISKGLGSFAGPIGSIAGGVVGGLLGDLFQTTKAGTTVLTNTSDSVKASGSTSEVAAGLTTIGTSIQSSLDAIASKFNTTVGSFAVSIGQYKDNYRVSAIGSDHVGDKYYPDDSNGDVIYDGTDQAQAVLVAIQNAIQDGAIKGLSTAVQKALSSSSDVEKAVTEALKVQEVELAIGGIGASMEKSFREEAQTAADRLTIAQKYGFDIVAAEKVNAAERLALQKQLLAQQVGSIQDVIDSMTSGDLFEGSAVDQRQLILTQITAARTDVANNVDGSADTLAKLLEQLNTVSKEAYGSTAAYAADRQLITDIARDTIATANQQVAAAAAASASGTTTTDATTAQLDEANDMLARIAAAVGTSADYLKAIATSGTTTDYSALSALVATS